MKTFIVLAAILCLVYAAPQKNLQQNTENYARILAQNFDIYPDGKFNYNYETENKIQANADGFLKVLSEKPYEDAEVIQGRYSWISPEGKTVVVEYVADETGYRPKVQIF